MAHVGSKLTATRGRRRATALVAVATLAVAAVAVVATAGAGKHVQRCAAPAPKAKNIIVMISDGCGYNQVLAADYYHYGRTGKQIYQKFPVRVGMSTFSASKYLAPPVQGHYDPALAWGDFAWVKTTPTDSASAATAMSTGFKNLDGTIGVDIFNAPLYNISQYAETIGKSTGVISSVEWSHATPAGYVAHNVSRNNYTQIAAEMIDSSRTDVIMGAGSPLFDDNGAPKATPSYKYVGQSTWDALVAGTAGGDANGDATADPWKLIQTEAQFAALTVGDTPVRVCGTAQVATTLQQSRTGAGVTGKEDPYDVPLNTNVPDLATMSKGALNVLDNNAKGFFLMIEGGAIDWASHANQSGRVIEEEIDFNKAVEAVCRWVEKNSSWNETLLVVTGDHETGYLWGPGSDPTWMPVVNNGKGNLPGMKWNSGDHTNSLIPFYAKGVGANMLNKAADQHDLVRGRYLDNTELGRIQFELLK
jgi:alkaline phosphatase